MNRLEELERVAHGLALRHGAMIRLFRAALSTDTETRLENYAARFELLLILEEFESRPPTADALRCLDLSDAGAGAVADLEKVIRQARELAAVEARLAAALDELYQKVAGAPS